LLARVYNHEEPNEIKMLALPFRIKICGVTTADDAAAVEQFGADAIGLNFYPKSKRYLDPKQAVAVAASISSKVTKVGVFVNSPAEEIRAVFWQVGLDVVQLHGDEPAEILSELNGLPTIRALQWKNDGGASIDVFLDECAKSRYQPIALLIDAHHPTEFGGTGSIADWSAIARWKQTRKPILPIILAGGLQPANVACAIETVGAEGVDTASGVETSPGRKDAKLVADFVRASKRAFSNY
jgi:phosphoribosylanthranilate isomerase